MVSALAPREERARTFLASLGYPPSDEDLPASDREFPGGGMYRIEIPSVEGPRSLRAVFDEADRLDVPVHRVSSGLGIALTMDADIREMVAMCVERDVELSLFVGPRANWDVGSQVRTPTGGIMGARHEGTDQLVYAMTDLMRANELGVRSALVADEGLLTVAAAMKSEGVIAPEFVLKVSVQLMAPNPVSAALLERYGACTINVPPGLTLDKLRGIRESTTVPLDMYVEAPETLGGFMRLKEIPKLVHALAPVYLKFGLKNHADVYPSGQHLDELNVQLSTERVRRAAIGLEVLRESGIDAPMAPIGGPGIGIPVSS